MKDYYEDGTPANATVAMRDLAETKTAPKKERGLVSDYAHLIADASMVLAEFALFLAQVANNGCREPETGEFDRRYQALYNAGLSELLDGGATQYAPGRPGSCGQR